MSKKKNSFERDLQQFKESPQKRGFFIERAEGEDAINEEERTAWLCFSSEEPYERWFGNEILGHKDGEVDLSRMIGAALLVGHNWNDQVGVVEEVRIDSDRRGRVLVRFGRGVRASEIFLDVVDGIRRQVSVGYFVLEMKLVKESENGPDDYRVTKWQPYEVSLVAVAADPSVGVGRHHEQAQKENQETKADDIPANKNQTKEVPKMDEENEVTTKPAPTVDVKAERAAAQNQEQLRVTELLDAGAKFGAMDEARAMIGDSTKTVEDLHKIILEKKYGGEATQTESPEIGMSERELNKFSFLRLMNAKANPTDKDAQRAAAFELDVCREAANVSKRDHKGVFIPHDVLAQKRDYSAVRELSTAGSVANTIPTDLMDSSFIDLLVNMLALRQCGATILDGLNGNIAIPRQIGGASSYWVAEGADVTPSDPVFDQVTMQPHSIAAATEFTRRTMLQSSLSMEAFARMDIVREMALGIDLAGINGSGVGAEPLGLMNQTGIGNSAVGGANGGAPTWPHIVRMETDIGDANALFGSLCYLTNSKVRGKLKETEKFAGGGREIWGEGNTLNGYSAIVSNQVPGNLEKGSSGQTLSAAIFGNFSDVLIGLWSGLDLLVDPYAKSLSGGVRVVAFQDVDVNVRRPESFSVFNDISTS